VSSSNVYDDAHRAATYATLDFPGTYYLAFRDLPAIIGKHVSGRKALDFGCGTGRSTRFLERLAFEATGIDIAASMIRMAQEADPDGRYLLVEGSDYGRLGSSRYNLIFSAFAFDNIPGLENRRQILRGLRGLLADGGRIILLGSTPEIYIHEWASFTTRDFPQNRFAQSGEEVRIVMKDVPDSRPVVDQVWFPDDYSSLFADCGLDLVDQSTPLGREDEPYDWLAETTVAPWIIYVLGSRP